MLVTWREQGNYPAMANILENIAFIENAFGRTDRAATLLGAAQRIREEIGQDMLQAERGEYDQQLTVIRSSLTPQELDKLWAAGRALSTDAVIALAQDEG